MAWVRGDDSARDNPRVMRSAHGGFLVKSVGSPQHERCVVFGFVALCVAWTAKRYSDLFVPEYVALDVGGADTAWLVAAAIKAGFLGKRQKGFEGDHGWPVIDNGDQLFHTRTRDEVEIDRARNHNRRLSVENMEVGARDGDQCRYCERTVTPLLPRGGDNQTARARTIDLVVPGDTLQRVVACRECNGRKGARSAEQWAAEGGYTLKPAPEDRGDAVYYHPDTVHTFRTAKKGVYAHLLRGEANRKQSNEQSKSIAGAAAEQQQSRSEGALTEQATPGREGFDASVSGRAGTGSGGSGQVPGPGPGDDENGGVA